ncbi:MAG: hypothetical protein D6748_07945 [Calditrichaeota bacterium]|nr:MAG: hypothetical protein D6748_07945 [Calditrichota bacterium]
MVCKRYSPTLPNRLAANLNVIFEPGFNDLNFVGQSGRGKWEICLQFPSSFF